MNIPKPIALAAAMFFVTTLAATNYYISNSGNNNNSGLSQQNAFQTIQHAAGLVSAGDTVFVANGTYAGFDLREANGIEANPIVFKALGDAVLVNQPGPIRNDGINIEDCSYIVIDGFKANNMPGNGNGIRVVLSDFCVVRRCSCDNNAERGIFTAFTDDILIEYNVCTNSVDEHGIYVSNSSDRPIVRNNVCYGNNNIGIHFNGDLSAGGDGIISDAQVYGNIIYDNNQAAGINMDGVENPIIYNNLIYNNHFGQGIALFQQDGAIPSRGAKIYNNTIIVPPDGRWGILVKEGSNAGTIIYNNIIINQHQWRGCIALDNTVGFISNYNILNDKMSADGDGSAVPLGTWQALGFDLNSILADAPEEIFIDDDAGDFHLKAGAQAINAGTGLVQNIVEDDLEGHPRPIGAAYDIGAYEFGTPTGLANVEAGTVKLFPNPASDFIVLDLQASNLTAKEIRLLSLKGEFVRQFPPDSQSLNIGGITKGAYFLEISLKDGRQLLEKVIVH
ncbi:MAG: right-handed parallel beta-helix repeat-containing protein [Lewinellaceae bacterium]|nr:right-handed parallel beta-helix repeat-containing protein [Lewinellaceae bacterium]